MIYDPDIKKGVKKRVLPEPNPTKVELPKSSSIQAVFDKATELYFKDLGDAVKDTKLSLADSNGIPIHIENYQSWILNEFFQHNGLQPSRYKLYVMLDFRCVSKMAMEVICQTD